MIEKNISIHHNGIYMEFAITTENQLKFLHFSSLPMRWEDLKSWAEPSDWGTGDKIMEGWPLVQVQVPGYDRPYEKPGSKLLVTAPGYALKYVSHQDLVNALGRCLVFVQEDAPTGLRVTTTMQFYGEAPVVRCHNLVENVGPETQTLEYVSSFFYQGFEKERKVVLEQSHRAKAESSISDVTHIKTAADSVDRSDTNQKEDNPTTDCGKLPLSNSIPVDEKMYLLLPHNSWMKEMNWKRYTIPELGLQMSQPNTPFYRTSKSFVIHNTGHWSTKEFLPMGYLGNLDANTGLFWQIEHNGSWVAEISDYSGHFCLGLSGPNELHSHWSKTLAPGEHFQSVPVAVGAVENSLDAAMAALTKYRRAIRRPNADDENLPVIFNDYMNCLFGDPTIEKEIPLIDAAAEAGCEYYVIDAGWYDDGFWWDSVGEWKEGRKRFPDGIKPLMDYIRSKGMIPGLWLEIEVMGIHCPLAENAPGDWFFQRHGRKIYDRSRYQLDFRHPGVLAHVNEVIRRVVEDYGCGYIKMDYNIEPGIGTEIGADSFGDGLLQHEQAYLAWIESIFQKYPDLVIENCSSGGLRMDYAMLSRYSIQSTSDVEDYRMYATIAANAPTGVTPEQAAVWSYPRRNADKEETIFNMVNALLLRIHQSGHLAELSEENKSYVHQGIRWYKENRHHWKNAVPHWPLGLSDYRDVWSALALEDGEEAWMALWKRDLGQEDMDSWQDKDTWRLGEGIMNSDKEGGCAENRKSDWRGHMYFYEIYLPEYIGCRAECAYPEDECDFTWDAENGVLTVKYPEKIMARIFHFM